MDHSVTVTLSCKQATHLPLGSWAPDLRGATTCVHVSSNVVTCELQSGSSETNGEPSVWILAYTFASHATSSTLKRIPHIHLPKEL